MELRLCEGQANKEREDKLKKLNEQKTKALKEAREKDVDSLLGLGQEATTKKARVNVKEGKGRLNRKRMQKS